jgi:hypothetical protein
MKLILWLVFFFPALAYATPSRIILMRHGEKENNYALCDVGQQRSLALRDQFLGKGASQSLFPTAPPSLAYLKDLEPFSFPSTSVITRIHRSWIGMPTSSISISGAVFKKISPFLEADLKLVYVDDIFVLGSSILGVNKHFLTNNGVYYRIHHQNMSRPKHDAKPIDRLPILNQIINPFCTKFNIPRYPSIEDFHSETRCLTLLQKKLINLTLPENSQIDITSS